MNALHAIAARFSCDPRHYQLAVLSSLLMIGYWYLGFDITQAQLMVTFAVALGVQWMASKWLQLTFEPRSALITALSLCLLLRADSLGLIAIATAIAIGSKFTLRLRGRHIFNPANLALTVCVLATPAAWVSPGQWGQATLFAFAMAGVGFIVVTRARRLDITLAFLATFAIITLGRAAWLGDPLAIAWHQLQSGSLLLFAFFMISDPATTPRSVRGRVLFAIVVAVVAAFIRFNFYRADAVILALTACALLVPAIDALEARLAQRTAPDLQLEPKRPATCTLPHPIDRPINNA